MKPLFTLIVLLAALFAKSQNGNNEVLNNETVVKLFKAKLSSSVIISKIKSSKCEFNLSTEGIIELKKKDIPDEVIDAMLNKSSLSNEVNPVITQVNNNKQLKDDSIPSMASGIYLCHGTPCKFQELEPSVYSQAKTGNGLLSAFTYGLAKTKQTASLSGDKANLQIEANLPYFYFYFDKSQNGNLNNNSNIWWFSAATSPNEFILVKFKITSNKKNREVITGSWGSYDGMTSGIDDSQKIKFKYTKVSQGIYKVYFEEGLQKGEYCFMYAGSMASYGNAPLQKVFDFGIK